MGLKKILLVDDDPDFLNLLVHFLKDNNFQVIPANDGEMAKEILDMHRVELIISDYKMPHLDGLELLKWCKEHYKKTPLVLITAFEKVEETQEAYKMGADGFILKPIKKEEFLQKIRDLLNRKEETLAISEDLSHMYSSIGLKEYLSRKVTYPLYIKLTDTKYVKVANDSSGLTRDIVKRYLAKGLKNFYMKKDDYRKFLMNTVDIADVVKGHNKVDPEKKRKFMIHASEIMITEIYADGLDKDLFNGAKKYSEAVLDSLADSQDIMDILESLNTKGGGFLAHTLGVATFAVMVAEKLGLENTKTKVMLGMAGLFHDIGKKDLSAEILNKPGSQLTVDERKQVEEHPYKGATLLNQLLNDTDPELVQIIMQHHEFHDGTGYPFKLKRHKIFRMAQIVAVVDTFSDLIIKSAEGERLSPVKAIKKMEMEYSNKFDPAVFEALKKIVVN